MTHFECLLGAEKDEEISSVVLDAEQWIASLVVEEDPARRAGEVLACIKFATWQREQEARCVHPESKEETDRNYLLRIAEIKPWESALHVVCG